MTFHTAGRRTPPPEFTAIARAYRCPDCASETGDPVEVCPGRWRMSVHHDETCPTYRRLLAQGLAT